MNIEDIEEKWNDAHDYQNNWDAVSCNKKIEFAIMCIIHATRSSLNTLETAVYFPDESSCSVGHAICHVRQVLSTLSNQYRNS